MVFGNELPKVIRAAPNVHRQKLDFFERNASVALNTVVTETEHRSRGMEIVKCHRRKSVVFGSGALSLFPYGERVSLGRRGGLQWEP